MTGDVRLRAVAGVVLSDGAGRTLLMRRRGEGTWGIPGGGLEPGETWVGTAIRECREETGWLARIDGLLGIYSDPATQLHRYPGGAERHFVGVVFLATATQRDDVSDDEAIELRWVTPDNLPHPLFAPDVPVLRDAFAATKRRPVLG